MPGCGKKCKKKCRSCHGAKKLIAKGSKKKVGSVGLIACPRRSWSPCVLPVSSRCTPKPKFSKKQGPLIDTTNCSAVIELADNDHVFGANAMANFTLGNKFKFKKLSVKGTATLSTGSEDFKFKKLKTNKNGEFSFDLPANTTSFQIVATLSLRNGCNSGKCNKKKCCVRVRSEVFSQYSEDLYWMTYDGSANNLTDPRFGMRDTALLQVTPISYQDGVTALAVRGPNNPNPRVISNAICKSPSSIPSAAGLTDLVWGFGQFIDHEIDLTKDGDSEPANMVTESVMDDPNEDFPGRTINFHRSAFIAGTSPRQHPNHISAFIDATNVYGYARERAYALRLFDGTGRLILTGGGLLPENTAGFDNANGGTLPDDELFLAGDVRANENTLLIAHHTLFAREHNRLCTDVIPGRYPQFVDKDELMWQHGRRYVSGLMQAITYNEFLPALLGPHGLGAYTGYDDTVNAGIRKEFSTVGYRLGHTMLSDVLKVGNAGDTLGLMSAFFTPDWIKANGIDGMLLGAGLQVQQEIDGKIVDAVRNNLFGPPTAGNLLDLAALNIQRGRDHGVGTYNDVRVAYGLPAITSYAQISSASGVAASLEALYGAGNHDHVDPWVGCIVEDHLTGASVGETLAAILRDQFGRLRDGDRYFYLNDAGLSQEEKDEIDATRFVDVIVRNTNLTHANFGNRRDVFHL